MMQDVLSKQVKITQAITPDNGTADTADIEGEILDMQGYDGVMMVCTFGAITASAVTKIKAQSGADSGLSDAADLENTSQSVADDDDNKAFYIDLTHVTERYVRLYVTRGTANAVVAAATYVQYKARELPVAAHGSGVSGEQHDYPSEGTA